MGWINRLRDYVKNIFSGHNKKKSVENAVIVIIIGVIIIIAGSTLLGKNKENEKLKNAPEKTEGTSVQEVGKVFGSDDNGTLERKIEKILSQINGAGKVTVMITYISGNEKVPATEIKKTENNTDEKDNGGGKRVIKQNDYETKVAFEEEQGGGKKPIILKELLPEVKGVVIVADGAADPQVKESLCNAVKALVDVPVHRIQVFERNK